ncbi:hypothetical protein D5086_005645 [Populus alba]|uniref:Uncharacterized protein n=1 Tax=Populus alba TaxID=43335 RepID=A0ACC4CTV5_POPAL
MDSEEADQYIQKVKEQQQRGLQELKGDRVAKEGDVFSYKVEPYTLSSGDYVVHKKVGIGSPNDTKKPRTLSKLSDNGAWERRKTKGKVAIQKMVVDLMELYLHRLKQRRPPYPKTSAMVDFSAQFPYEPTPDQKQSKAETEMNLEMIKHGHLDIIVGTHSLLGSRVVYNNLGLLVVDEEQRFGVKQKGKIASFKTLVDVLTLTAAPIPRMLYLALTGFQDARSLDNLKSAMDYKVKDAQYAMGLEEVKDFLEQSFSNVEIAVAHGQQYSKLLEDTMEQFAQGEIKILICTNIVENRLVIQNANTIIIQDVQLFGLTQLYQLRGRVGRADKEAHAHLFYPDKSMLTDQALVDEHRVISVPY